MREHVLYVAATTETVRRWWAWRALPVAAAVAAVTLFGSLGAHALEPTHDYPTRSIRVLMGFSAGGITDLLARTRAQELSRKLALGRFSTTPHIRADKFKAVGTAGTLPLPAFRDAAPIAEGLPGFGVYGGDFRVCDEILL